MQGEVVILNGTDKILNDYFAIVSSEMKIAQ